MHVETVGHPTAQLSTRHGIGDRETNALAAAGVCWDSTSSHTSEPSHSPLACAHTESAARWCRAWGLAEPQFDTA